MSLKTTKRTAFIAVFLLSIFVFQTIFFGSANEGIPTDENGVLMEQDYDYYFNLFLEENSLTQEIYDSLALEDQELINSIVSTITQYYNGEISKEDAETYFETINHSCVLSISFSRSDDGLLSFSVTNDATLPHLYVDYTNIYVYNQAGTLKTSLSDGSDYWNDHTYSVSFTNPTFGETWRIDANGRVYYSYIFGKSYASASATWYRYIDDDDKIAPTISVYPESGSAYTPYDSSPDSVRTLRWSITDNTGLSNVNVQIIRNGITIETRTTSNDGITIPRSDINAMYSLFIVATDNDYDNSRSADKLTSVKASGTMKVLDDDTDYPSLTIYQSGDEWTESDIVNFYDSNNYITIDTQASDSTSGIRVVNGIYAYDGINTYPLTVIDDDGVYVKSGILPITSLSADSGDGDGGDNDDAHFDWVRTLGSTLFESKLHDDVEHWWGEENDEYFYSQAILSTYQVPVFHASLVGYPLSPSQEAMWMTYNLVSVQISFDEQAFDWWNDPITGSYSNADGDNRLRVYYNIDGGSWIELLNRDGNGDNRNWYSHSYTISANEGDVITVKAFHDGIAKPESYVWYPIDDYKEARVNNVKIQSSFNWDILSDSVISFGMQKTEGLHSFTVSAVDGDADWSGDALTTTHFYTYNVIDDDKTAPTINWQYVGDYTDNDAGYILVTAFDTPEGDEFGLSVDPSGKYYLDKFTLDTQQIFTFTATDKDSDRPNDALSTTVTVKITLTDDDKDVSISDLQCETTIDEITITFKDTDKSGIASFDWITVDGNIITPTSVSSASGIWTVKIANEWIFELGTHAIQFQLTDGDKDRKIGDVNIDTTRKSFDCSFEITEDLLVEWIDAELEDLIDMCLECNCWTQKNRKATMVNKINEVIALKEAGYYAEAYDKVLHDIKPKLTGLKQDELGNTYGNADFQNAWVCSECFANFEAKINPILSGLNLLF